MQQLLCLLILPKMEQDIIFVWLPEKDQRKVHDALPSQRFLPYAVWRHLPKRIPGPGILRTSPSCDVYFQGMVGKRQDRSRTGADRDERRVADVLPRSHRNLQRIRLL